MMTEEEKEDLHFALTYILGSEAQSNFKGEGIVPKSLNKIIDGKEIVFDKNEGILSEVFFQDEELQKIYEKYFT